MNAALPPIIALIVATSAPAPTDRAASSATMADVRNVGTAMMSWLVDQITELPYDSPAQQTAAADPRQPLDWSKCPAISRQDLERLVPDYIREIPREDGWGNDFEFCLETHDFNRPHALLGVRSPGRDGLFERADYLPGAFDLSDFDADVVWLDGFFVRWPQNEAQP